MLQCYDRAGFGHVPPNILWKRVIPVIADFFVGRTWKANGTRNRLNYCANFILLKYYTNEAADRIIHKLSAASETRSAGFRHMLGQNIVNFCGVMISNTHTES